MVDTQEKLTLSQYIALIGDVAAASMFGVSVGTARAYRDGRRIPKPSRAAIIIRATGGKLGWEDVYAAELRK